MYLHEVKVKNYSIHKETNIELSPIAVFVGPNGSGKSAFFEALLNFSMLARGRLSEAFGPYPYSFSATRYRGATQISRIGYDVLMSATPNSANKVRYKIDYSQVAKGSEGTPPHFEIYTESLEVDGKILFDRSDPDGSVLQGALKYLGGDIGILSAVRRAELDGAATGVTAVVVELAKEVSRLNRFRLEPYALRGASPLPDLTAPDAPRIGHAGENAAATLYFLDKTGSPALTHIVDGLKRALPDFDSFEFNTVSAQRIGFSMRFSDVRGSITAPRLSDGQLLVVGLMALLHGPGRPPVLMVEEPENGLTPPVQREVYKAVGALAFGQPPNRSQVLIASHSPFVLCDAWNGEDREFVHQMKVEDGRAAVRRFSEAVKAQGIQLAKDADGNRLHLGLRNAEELMAGYLV